MYMGSTYTVLLSTRVVTQLVDKVEHRGTS
jgi:hypothetical protein